MKMTLKSFPREGCPGAAFGPPSTLQPRTPPSAPFPLRDLSRIPGGPAPRPRPRPAPLVSSSGDAPGNHALRCLGALASDEPCCALPRYPSGSADLEHSWGARAILSKRVIIKVLHSEKRCCAASWVYASLLERPSLATCVLISIPFSNLLPKVFHVISYSVDYLC